MVVNGISLSNLDRETSPKHNFYRFANGGWLAKNPIPSSYSRWGAFEELNEKSNEQLRAILDDCVANPSDDPNRIACAILYATGMDESKCTKVGLSCLTDVFDAINEAESGHDILCLAARLRAVYGVSAGLFSVYSLPDAKNSTWEVVMLSQAGSLGIGDRDFYLRDDKQQIRDKYVRHVAEMLQLADFCQSHEEANRAAQDIMALETSMAESCMTKTELRDPLKTYNKCVGVSELERITKVEETAQTLPWGRYFDHLGLPEKDRDTIIVNNPRFFTALNRLLEETPIEVWRMYFRFHVLTRMADYLGKDIEEKDFAFFGTVMTGQPEMKPRWKRVLNTGVTAMLEDSLGILYTGKHFNAQAKQACLDMVNVLTDVLRKRIDEVDWMQQETKEKAKQKLDQFRAMIGYPDRWDVNDVPDLLKHISMENSFCENVRACNVRKFRKVIERINKPVDPHRWEMPSTLVNAYFHPLKNVIVFPAAILQPPFFFHPSEESPYGDPAVNFSAIGAVICHEISHGYDDQGRKFDAKGELSDWWTEDDAAEYERRAANMVKLCDNYEVFGKNLNGNLCLGENIADYGGVKLSFKGLKTFMEKYGRLPDVDGFTPEQRFFLGWASIWRNNIREEMALQRIITDPHAPGEFRANIVQVIEEFHEAFGVEEGDTMWQPPEARCEIW